MEEKKKVYISVLLMILSPAFVDKWPHIFQLALGPPALFISMLPLPLLFPVSLLPRPLQ